MQKRIVAFILFLAIITTSTFAYAAPGDIIHTGLKKIYKADSSADVDELLQDILAGADTNKFYREIDNNKYVNIAQEEDKQVEKLGQILNNIGITNPEDIEKYIIDNKDYIDGELNKLTKSMATGFDEIDDKDKGRIEEYQGASNAILLGSTHYSTPEPGTKEKTTKIERLNTPSGATKWMIKIKDEKIPPMAKDTLLSNAINYKKGNDIEIEVGQYLVLYAVDNNNRIKGYANIKITDNMVKPPKEEAIKLEIGKVESGSINAGTVVINGLYELPEGASKWQVMVSNTPIDRLYKGEKLDEANDYDIDSEIIMANENELHNLTDDFKKYIILIAANNEDKTIGYRIFEINKDNISKAPILLKETIDYEGPVPGDEDGTTKFSELKSKENSEWKYVISNEKPRIPVIHNEVEGTQYIDNENIGIQPGQYLLLMETVDGKVEKYKVFRLVESQVKGLTAPKIEDDNIKLDKGSKAGTTKVIGLNLDNIEDTTKWMFKVGQELSPPILNKIVDKSSDYISEKDIEITVEDQLLILATDDDGRIKAYILFDEISKDMIKDPAPVLLIEGRDFTKPVKGSQKGTTKIQRLTPTIDQVDSWRYKISSKPLEIPEMNNMVDNTSKLEEDMDIGENLKGNEYLLLIAVKKESDEIYATKGYAIFQLNENQVYNGPAINLQEDDKWKDNYSTPEPGSMPNTTKISTLNTLGIPDGDNIAEWRYRIFQENIDTPIEMDSKIDRTSRYIAGNNIRADIGDILLIIATDRYAQVKAYAIFEIEGKDIRSPNAQLLMPITNYTEPEPGNIKNSTKFGFLSFAEIDGLDENNGKWMYKIGDRGFGPIELNSMVSEAVDYSEYIKDVSIGDYLLLLATDSDGKVKAYREFRLSLDQIRGNEAINLNSEKNYTIERGSIPGTTKFSRLDFLGVPKEANSWRYKLIETIEEKKQIEENIYNNYIVEGTTNYTVNRDISVNVISNNEPKYGYILLLATDSRGRTKGYDFIEINPDMVKEHAEILDVKLIPGGTVDTVKVVEKDSSNLLENNYKILITKTPYPKPAKGDILKNGAIYENEDISVLIGEYVNIFQLDSEDTILKFNSLKVEEVNSINAILETSTISEDRINNGGQKITLTIDDGGEWEDLSKDKGKRDALYRSFKTSNQSTEWTKVINALIEDGGTLSIAGKTLTFWLPKVEEYDISEEQQITLTIPPSSIVGAKNNIKVEGSIIIKPIVEATIKGDVVSSTIRQKDIKNGGKTIIIELGDGNWIGDIEKKKNTLLGCFQVIDTDDNIVTEKTQWSKIVDELNDSQDPKTIIRNSSKMVTITLPKVTNFELGTDSETIKLTIPKDKGLVLNATSDIVANPTFTIYPDILQVNGIANDENKEVILMAPDYKIVDENKDTWIIDVERGTLKDDIDNNDVNISGLPRGLKANVSKVEDENQIKINISGTASTSLANNLKIQIKIKGTAVTEPNSIDSENIELQLIKGESIIGDLEKVKIDVAAGELINTSEEMQYSLDSTNGSNGYWYDCDSYSTTISGGFGPGRVYIRDKNNHRVFHLVATLNYPKAPIGISIGEVNYSENNVEVKLNGLEVDVFYDYNIDGDEEWEKLDISKSIVLNDDLNLRVRYRATEDSLHSLDSKINILDLRNVDIDVSQGIIDNTTTGMEYSLNNGDEYKRASSNKTSVQFREGNTIIVRERTNPGNKRKVITISKESIPIETSYDIEAKTIIATPPEGGNIQYRIGDEPWKDLPSEGEKIEFKPGKVQVRTKATKYNIASESVDVGEEILNPSQKPELRLDDFTKDISYWDGSKYVKLEDATNLEYKINDGDWKNSGDWSEDKDTDLIQNTNANISVRFKATEKTLPSQIAIVNFTGNLTFANVKLNVVEGRIEGTTTAMEYSINSTDGLNGTWNNGKAGSTKVEFAKGMKVYIREKTKPLNKHQLSDGINVEEEISKDNFNYSIIDGSITNKTSRILEYKFNDENWNIVDRANAENESYTLHGIEFKPGRLQFRARGTKDTLPSPTITIDIKARASAPTLKYDDVSYKIEKIGTDEGNEYEYSINNGPWIDGNIDTQFDGGDTVKVRIIANEDTLPSQEQSIAFTPNLDLNNVILNIGESKLINTSTLMEYSVVFNDEEDGAWYTCNRDETSLILKEDAKVYIREKAKPRNNRKVTIEPVSKKEFINGTKFIKENIDYNILQKTISIINPTTNEHQRIIADLQYRINNGNWVNVDYILLEDSKTKVLAYNVNFHKGDLEFRLKGSEDELPSDSVLKDTIKASVSAPNVKGGFDIDNYRNKVIVPEEIELKELEYSLAGSNGPWNDGIHLDEVELVGNVYIRTKATKNNLPSLPKELRFTSVLNLKTINFSTHVHPMELNGTTTDMEYGIWLGDENNNWLYNGEWIRCNDGNTKLPEWLKKENLYKIIIRDKNQPSNQHTIYP